MSAEPSLRDPATPSARRLARFDRVEWALLTAFVVLTGLVSSGLGVQSVDDALLRLIPWSDAPGAPQWAAHLSYLLVLYASPEISLVVTLALAAAWSWRRGTLVPARRIVPPVLVGSFAVLVLKVSLHRSGPPSADPVGLLGYFPSGHTATALLCAGALAAAVSDGRPHLRLRLRVATGAWTALIAAALLYHRFHWTSDVLGSLLLCLLVLRLFARRQAQPGIRPERPSRTDAS